MRNERSCHSEHKSIYTHAGNSNSLNRTHIRNVSLLCFASPCVALRLCSLTLSLPLRSHGKRSSSWCSAAANVSSAARNVSQNDLEFDSLSVRLQLTQFLLAVALSAFQSGWAVIELMLVPEQRSLTELLSSPFTVSMSSLDGTKEFSLLNIQKLIYLDKLLINKLFV